MARWPPRRTRTPSGPSSRCRSRCPCRSASRRSHVGCPTAGDPTRAPRNSERPPGGRAGVRYLHERTLAGGTCPVDRFRLPELLGLRGGAVQAEVGVSGVLLGQVDQALAVVDVAHLRQLVEDHLHRIVGALAHGVDVDLRALGGLVRVGHAGEPGDLPRQRLRVQALDVPLGALLHRGVDVDLHELLDVRPALVSGVPVRRDGRHDGRHAVARQQVRHEADPQDVGVAVLLREPQALRQIGPNDVAAKELDHHVPAAKLVEQHLREGRLAGPGKAGEPHGEALLLGVVRHRKLLPTASSGGSIPYSFRMEGPTSRMFRPSRRPVGWPGAPVMTNTPVRSWLAPSGPVSFSYVNTSATVPARTAPTERHSRSPKYTRRSGATPRTSGYTSCGL